MLKKPSRVKTILAEQPTLDETLAEIPDVDEVLAERPDVSRLIAEQELLEERLKLKAELRTEVGKCIGRHCRYYWRPNLEAYPELLGYDDITIEIYPDNDGETIGCKVIEITVDLPEQDDFGQPTTLERIYIGQLYLDNPPEDISDYLPSRDWAEDY